MHKRNNGIVYVYNDGPGWEIFWYFVIWTQIGMCFKAGIILHIQLNAKNFSWLVDNYLIWFEYAEIQILINPFTANLGY